MMNSHNIRLVGGDKPLQEILLIQVIDFTISPLCFILTVEWIEEKV